MAKSPAIGYCTCPDCGHEYCEIKLDKNGHAYRFCPNDDCNLQTFTRDTQKSNRMMAKMRPIQTENAQGNEKPAEAIPQQQKPAEIAPKAQKSGLLID